MAFIITKNFVILILFFCTIMFCSLLFAYFMAVDYYKKKKDDEVVKQCGNMLYIKNKLRQVKAIIDTIDFDSE